MFSRGASPRLGTFRPRVGPGLQVCCGGGVSGSANTVPLCASSIGIFCHKDFVFNRAFSRGFAKTSPKPFSSPAGFIVRAFVAINNISN